MFSTYADAMKWVDAGTAAQGRNKFTSSDEYRAVYPQIAALHKAENAPRKRRASVEIPLFGSSLLMAIKDGRA